MFFFLAKTALCYEVLIRAAVTMAGYFLARLHIWQFSRVSHFISADLAPLEFVVTTIMKEKHQFQDLVVLKANSKMSSSQELTEYLTSTSKLAVRLQCQLEGIFCHSSNSYHYSDFTVMPWTCPGLHISCQSRKTR